MLTILILLGVAAFLVTIVASLGRAPLWVAVLLLAIAELLRALPLGR